MTDDNSQHEQWLRDEAERERLRHVHRKAIPEYERREEGPQEDEAQEIADDAADDAADELAESEEEEEGYTG
jgi:hypothetical protein